LEDYYDLRIDEVINKFLFFKNTTDGIVVSLGEEGSEVDIGHFKLDKKGEGQRKLIMLTDALYDMAIEYATATELDTNRLKLINVYTTTKLEAVVHPLDIQRARATTTPGASGRKEVREERRDIKKAEKQQNSVNKAKGRLDIQRQKLAEEKAKQAMLERIDTQTKIVLAEANKITIELEKLGDEALE